MTEVKLQKPFMKWLGGKSQIINEIINMVRNEIGPVASFKKAIIVKRLPKTRSGKILRSTISAIYDNKPFKTPATIDDVSILDEIKSVIKN